MLNGHMIYDVAFIPLIQLILAQISKIVIIKNRIVLIWVELGWGSHTKHSDEKLAFCGL